MKVSSSPRLPFPLCQERPLNEDRRLVLWPLHMLYLVQTLSIPVTHI